MRQLFNSSFRQQKEDLEDVAVFTRQVTREFQSLQLHRREGVADQCLAIACSWFWSMLQNLKFIARKFDLFNI